MAKNEQQNTNKEETKPAKSDKTLKNKAIKIQGKDYVLVSDRVIYFNENYPRGQIITTLLSNPGDKNVIFKAVVIPDIAEITEKGEKRYFVAHAQEVVGEGFINKTSALENAETSAVGRALAFMGIGVVDSIASIDEIAKAEKHQSAPSKTNFDIAKIGISRATDSDSLKAMKESLKASKKYTVEEKDDLFEMIKSKIAELECPSDIPEGEIQIERE